MEQHRNAEGTYNGVGVMSELTGLPRPEIVSMWEKVKANGAKLQACPYHEFELTSESARLSQNRYTCKHCQGEVVYSDWMWHERGRRARPA